MSNNILHYNETESVGSVDIDTLFENSHKKDQKQLAIFNKLLNRVHHRIQLTGKKINNDKYIFFNVPEYLFGEPLYNQGDCIGYLVVKLEENGFVVKYIHPNTLLISWKHWIPSYVRNEFKRKTGNTIDERGNIIKKKEEVEEYIITNDISVNNKSKDYKSISQYKPTGNLIYSEDLVKRLETKL